MMELPSADLQRAVYQRLSGDPGVRDMVGDAIYDAPLEVPVADSPEIYVTIGEELVRDFSTKTSSGSRHDFDISVHSCQEGFDRAKRIGGRICALLVDADLDLGAAHLVSLRFLRARATRGPSPLKRQVSLRFRAVVDSD